MLGRERCQPLQQLGAGAAHFGLFALQAAELGSCSVEKLASHSSCSRLARASACALVGLGIGLPSRAWANSQDSLGGDVSASSRGLAKVAIHATVSSVKKTPAAIAAAF